MITEDKKCGLLDFQDARIGPALYDLMSLIEDDRRPVDTNIRNEALHLYFSSLPELDTPNNREIADIVALQRHTKVAGIFVRLCVRDGKERYLKMLPFVWQRIESHLNNPLFCAYRDWIEKYIPISMRRNIPVLEKK
jgi:aminoglycoside/choline kinase family phosphotransferase